MTARQKQLDGTVSLQLQIAAAVTLLFAVAAFLPETTSAQEIDFGKLDKFESFASGTLHVGAPPKTIVDDGERHLVILTIWNGDAETKVYWRSPDGNAPRTTVYLDVASKHSKPLESSNWKPSVSPITRSNTDICCWVFGNERKLILSSRLNAARDQLQHQHQLVSVLQLQG